MPGSDLGGKTFLLIWADTAEPVRLTPSVLLAHLILCSRRVCPQSMLNQTLMHVERHVEIQILSFIDM